jgi:hypothetical protein
MRHGYYMLSDRDFNGYGVYERDRLRSGAFGQLPDLSSLQQFEDVRGLAHVPTAAKLAAKAALEMMVLSRDPAPELGGVSGQASFILGQLGTPWVTQLVGQGMVVMIERASIASGTPKVLASALPPSVVMFAGTPNPRYVIVDAHPVALAAAEAFKAGTAPPATPPGQLPQPPVILQQGGCPTGMVEILGQCFARPPCPSGTQEVFGVCMPMLGQQAPPIPPIGPVPPPPIAPPPGPPPPTAPPPVEPTTAKLPSWALPAAIGVGAVAIGAVIFARRRRGPMRPNRYRAWG